MLFLLAQAGSWLPAIFHHERYDDDGDHDEYDNDCDEYVEHDECGTAVKVMSMLFSWKSQQNFIHSQSANIVSKVGGNQNKT